MEEKIKIMIVPSLNDERKARDLGEKLADMGHEVKLIEGAFGEITGLEILSKGGYREWKPDLVVALGVGCIAVGTFVNAMRIMINPDFHYSDFCKKWVQDREERINSGMYDEDKLFEIKQACDDAEYDSHVAEKLESKEESQRGEKPMLCIYTSESYDIADYEERYGDNKLYLPLDILKSDSLNIVAEKIDQFLKEALHK